MPLQARAAMSQLWFLLLILLTASTIIDAKEQGCNLIEAGVSVGISPISIESSTRLPTRFIEVFWWGTTTSFEGDWIGIWSGNPGVDMTNPLDSFPFNGELDGHSMFSVVYDPSTVPDNVTGVVGAPCLPYWVGYVSNGSILYSDCLQIHPNWMNEMKDVIGSANLTDILLPGSHDAGSTTWYQDWWADGFIGNIVSKWAITQDDGMWQQLVFGVRYLDMRISYYPNKPHLYYINHGVVIMAPLYLYLEDISRFLSQTNEIVIFDVQSLEHNFNAYPEAASGLFSLFDTYFSNYMISNSYEDHPTLDSLWSSSRGLIVTYPGDELTSEMYWHQVSHLYGAVNTLEELYLYFDVEIPKNAGNNSLWSAMTEFTPTAIDVAVDRWGGLAGAANVTNQPVSMRLRRDWWMQVNILAMDFVMGSDIIDTIIEANKVKFMCQYL